MSTPRDFPTSVCARFADALPLYTSGELDPAETNALRAHLHTCPDCRARLSGYDALDAAVRLGYGIPQATAPFLSLDTIVSRTASADARHDVPPVTAPPCVAADVKATPIVAFSAWVRRRPVPTIHEDDIMFDQHETPPAPAGTVSGTHHHRRARGVAGFAAAVALVALAVAVFQGFGGARHAGTGKGNTQQPATKATHYLGTNGTWDTVTSFHSNANDYTSFAVAPNNPSIVYQAGPGLTMQRSTDGGASWTTLSLPTRDVPAGSTDAGVSAVIDPLNASTVFAIIGASSTDPKCPTPIANLGSRPHIGAKIAFSGGYSCSFEYVSQDSGATWQSLNLPAAGDVGQGIGNGGFAVQSGAIYSLLVPDLNGPAPLGYRLVKSSDGVTWQYADADLAAHGLSLSQFVAAATGGELFGVSVPSNGINGGGDYTSDLWHSTDAGAHWSDVGHFTSGQSGYAQLIGVSVTASGRAQVYYSGVSANGAQQQIYVSADSGRTWQLISYAGLPADLTQATSTQGNPTPAGPEWPGTNGPRLQYVATLADGTLVVEYAHTDMIPLGTPQAGGGQGYLLSNSHIVYYGLTPGSTTWTQLTPQLHDGFVTAQWVSAAHGSHPDAIYALERPYNPDELQSTTTTLTLYRCALTA